MLFYILTIQSALGSAQILVMGRLKVPVAVLSVTTLVNPSSPVCGSLITAFFHTKGGKLSSFTSTKSPVFTFGWMSFHLFLCCNWWRQSWDQCFHNCWIHSHFDKRFEVTSNKLWSGKASKEVPMRKWPGVKTWRLSGLLDKERIGHEFNTASAWQSKV